MLYEKFTLPPHFFSWLSARPAPWRTYPQLAARGGALALLLLLGACEKPDLEPGEAGVAAARQTDSSGKSKDNPFTVEVMRKALKNLQNGKNGGGDFSTMTTVIAPTHRYVRFKPADTDQLADLQDLGLQLSFEPLDETAAANTFVDYSAAEIPWVYSAVPYEVEMPYYIQRENLENLYLFNEDDGDQQDDPWEPDPEPEPPTCEPVYDSNCRCYIPCEQAIAGPTTQAKRNNIKAATEQLKQAGISPLALYNEAMRITGHKEEIIEEPAPGGITIQSHRYYPSGTIRVQETELGANVTVPVRRVNVISRRWFKVDDDLTDDNGYFFINKGYRGKAQLFVEFKNTLATTRGFTRNSQAWDIVLPISSTLGTYEDSRMENMSYSFMYNADSDSKNALTWVAATTFNAQVDAHTFSAARGISAPVSGLNIWLASLVVPNASTPMLRRIAATSDVSKALDLFLAGISGGRAVAIKKVLQRQLPDITYRYGGGDYGATRESDAINRTFYHELGHSQHYGQVGNNFWTAYITYVLRYGNADNPYGQKTDNDASRIAISEGWGNYVERLFLSDKYRSTLPRFATDALNELENQVPYDSDPNGWFVYGMLHDMTDVGEPFTGVVDNVDSFNAAAVFRGLQPQANSVRAYQEVIRVQNNNLQAAQMEQLVTSYRW